MLEGDSLAEVEGEEEEVEEEEAGETWVAGPAPAVMSWQGCRSPGCHRG